MKKYESVAAVGSGESNHLPEKHFLSVKIYLANVAVIRTDRTNFAVRSIRIVSHALNRGRVCLSTTYHVFLCSSITYYGCGELLKIETFDWIVTRLPNKSELV